MITDAQRISLEKLWYVYGQQGPQWTIGNHKLIQRLLYVDNASLEECIARYNAMMDNDPDKSVTAECIAAVQDVLK